jgi:hypothetical protein
VAVAHADAAPVAHHRHLLAANPDFEADVDGAILPPAHRLVPGGGEARPTRAFAQAIGARPGLADAPRRHRNAAAKREPQDEALLAQLRPAVMARADRHGDEGEFLQRHVLENGEQAGRQGVRIVHPHSIAPSGSPGNDMIIDDCEPEPTNKLGGCAPIPATASSMPFASTAGSGFVVL